MIKIVYSKRFLKSVFILTPKIQEKLSNLLYLIQENPFHQKLRTKRLAGELTGFLSFRITRDWRVIFQFINSSTIQLLRVVHRKDSYR